MDIWKELRDEGVDSGLLDEVPSLAHKLLKGMAKRVREADAAGLH